MSEQNNFIHACYSGILHSAFDKFLSEVMTGKTPDIPVTVFEVRECPETAEWLTIPRMGGEVCNIFEWTNRDDDHPVYHGILNIHARDDLDTEGVESVNGLVALRSVLCY